MKTIFIATDFSNAARNASLYGVRFAKMIGAKIILFNAYKLPKAAPGLGISVSRYDAMMQTDKRLLEEAEIIDPKGEIVDVLCDEGSPQQTIINAANEKKADFIITGMNGSGKSIKKLMGSTATLLARNTNIPLIIVPESARFTNPGIIVFATDTTDQKQNRVIPADLASIAQTFNSKLYVVRVIKSSGDEWFEIINSRDISKQITQVADTSFQYPADTDIRHALNTFIKEHNADMLVMIPHHHEWRERLYRKSNTADMIFHSKIPLLVLPDTNKYLQKKKIRTFDKASV